MATERVWFRMGDGTYLLATSSSGTKIAIVSGPEPRDVQRNVASARYLGKLERVDEGAVPPTWRDALLRAAG